MSTLFPMSKNFLFLILPSSQDSRPTLTHPVILRWWPYLLLFKRSFQVMWPDFQWRAWFLSWCLFSSSRYFIFSKTGSCSPKLCVVTVALLQGHAHQLIPFPHVWCSRFPAPMSPSLLIPSRHHLKESSFHPWPSGAVGLSPSLWGLEGSEQSPQYSENGPSGSCISSQEALVLRNLNFGSPYFQSLLERIM